MLRRQELYYAFLEAFLRHADLQLSFMGSCTAIYWCRLWKALNAKPRK